MYQSADPLQVGICILPHRFFLSHTWLLVLLGAQRGRGWIWEGGGGCDQFWESVLVLAAWRSGEVPRVARNGSHHAWCFPSIPTLAGQALHCGAGGVWSKPGLERGQSTPEGSGTGEK